VGKISLFRPPVRETEKDVRNDDGRRAAPAARGAPGDREGPAHADGPGADRIDPEFAWLPVTIKIRSKE